MADRFRLTDPAQQVEEVTSTPGTGEQVAEAGDGEVGQHAAFEHRPDALRRIQKVA